MSLVMHLCIRIHLRAAMCAAVRRAGARGALAGAGSAASGFMAAALLASAACMIASSSRDDCSGAAATSGPAAFEGPASSSLVQGLAPRPRARLAPAPASEAEFLLLPAILRFSVVVRAQAVKLQ